ncbi:hypothetical protein C1H46_015514 [Malus baccata]|uniref:Uncharacterized protein n=1 Tax=Malus baccata TaxID=106549 RepID=A0A540MJC7_MALBA|nr:hypothetical protein C1H46_015514 [Malus baccata]
MMPSSVLQVKRLQLELITPAKPTPRETKFLSYIDDQEKLKASVKAIREALSKALVYYYPLAGRLREGPNRKLMVDCNGEGILFVEASADVTLEQLGDKILPPCPLLEEFLFNFPGSDGIIGCQVTRLICGGFILALRLNHTMCDAPGLLLFLNAIAEMARGAHAPSILPVWERVLLFARDPPRITCAHHEYEDAVRVSCAVNACGKHRNVRLPLRYYGNAFAFPAVVSKAEPLCKNPLGYALELVTKAKATMNEE